MDTSQETPMKTLQLLRTCHSKKSAIGALHVKIQGSRKEGKTDEITSFPERLSAIDVPKIPGSPLDRSKKGAVPGLEDGMHQKGHHVGKTEVRKRKKEK